MGLSRTDSEINGDFGRKLQFFSTPVYLALVLRGFSWNFVRQLGLKQETRLMLTTHTTRLEVSQGQQTWTHGTIRYVWFPISVL